jgi:DNA-binding transcriptional LysR family regulator
VTRTWPDSRRAHPAQSIIVLVASGAGIGFIASETQRLDRAGVTYCPIRGAGPLLSIAVAYHTDEAASLVQTFLAVASTCGDGGAASIDTLRVSSWLSKVKRR